MKKLLLLNLLFFPFLVISQNGIEPHDADLYLGVQDMHEQMIPFYEVICVDAINKQVQRSITDTKGIARFRIITGKNYLILTSDSSMFAEVNIPFQTLSFITQKVTLPQQNFASYIEKRTAIDTIDQNNALPIRPDQGCIFLKIGLFDQLNQPVKNKEVRIFDNHLLKVFKAKTNSMGFAQFHVRGLSNYIVGIDKFEHFEEISVPHHSLGLVMTFIPTKIRETLKNDTIFQESDVNMRATSERVLTKIYIQNHERQYLAGESIFFNEIGSTKVYKGITGKDGSLTMMLPKGFQYEMNLTYERAIKRFDFPLSPTQYSTSVLITYRGTKKIEEYYKNMTRDGEYRNEFMEGKAERLSLEPGVLEKTTRGFNLNFPDNGPILTPAVYQKKLLVSAGYYNPNIYCVDAETGNPVWGIQLAENGPSVLVVDQGMLLINTQSCTLYAIDIETGILAWSKWLGPNIFHSPTVADGKVFAAYPEGLNYSIESCVLAAFDIKTGAILWQNRLKNEPLGAPVYDNNKLYVTDLGGWLYFFDANIGTQKALRDVRAINPPAIDGTNLWVSVQNPENPFLNTLMQYHANNFEPIKAWNQFTDSTFTDIVLNTTSSEKMSFTRNRILADKTICYQINKLGLQAFEPSTQKILWTFPVRFDLKNNPILTFAGKYLLASVNKVKIALINPQNGQKFMEFYTQEILSSEPAIANGWIYCGTKNGRLVAINTKDKTIGGWFQWGMNGTHNPRHP